MTGELADGTTRPQAVRFGLVGYRFGARYFHAPLLATSPACELVETVPGAWPEFYAQFAAAVRGAGPLPVTDREAVETARVLDAAATSATSGEVVHVEPTD